MTDALVTGAHGFIGQALCAALRADGQAVDGIGREFGDISDARTWEQLAPARVLYHLAGRSFVPDSWQQGPDFVAANVLGTEHALAWCRRHGARMVFASAYLYGIPEKLPLCEDDPVRPNNPYALTKRLAEQLCEFAAEHQGLSGACLRVFNVFGPGQRQEFLIPAILGQLDAAEIRLGALAPKRDYVHLSDVVSAFMNAGRLEQGFHILNVGSGRSLSVAEIVDIIQDLAGTSLPVISAVAHRKQEIPDVVADISRINDILGWEPRISMRDGLADLIRNRGRT